METVALLAFSLPHLAPAPGRASFSVCVSQNLQPVSSWKPKLPGRADAEEACSCPLLLETRKPGVPAFPLGQ